MAKSAIRLVPLALVALPGLLRAQDPEPLVTDRPDFTESASSVAPGRVQVEAGATLESADDVEAWTVGEVLARIGVTGGIELRVGVPSWIDADGFEGLDDGFLGAKVEIPLDSAWEAALLAGTSVPVGDEDVAARAWQPEVVAALARDLSERVAFGVNAGWGRPEEGGERVDEFLGSVALGVDAGDGWGVFLETFGTVTDGDGRAFVDGGVTRLLGSDLQLDARVGAGVGDVSGDWFAGVGFSRRW